MSTKQSLATPVEFLELAQAALFSPALSTLQKSLDLNYNHNLPGLTSETLKKYTPQSASMTKGHLDQLRKNQRSIKKNSKTSTSQPVYEPVSNSSPIDDSLFPPSDPENNRNHHCYETTFKIPTTGKIFTDQTSSFPIPSSTGNQYIFVLYDYDSN